ncbi:MAG: MBL fold metallo-hydrolase [Burkholderiaceae bacterium]
MLHLRIRATMLLVATSLLATGMAPGITCAQGQSVSPAAAPGRSSPPAPIVKEGKTIRVSEHVHVIPDERVPMVPNVGIVVGEKATLVIDPGMGRRSGEAVLREVRKLARTDDLVIANTHFHPEHTTGDLAFPATVRLFRARAQQQDVDEMGMKFVEMFSGMRPALAEILQGASFRTPTELFDRETTVDLGGVRVRMIRLGPGHTRGDTAFHVEGDSVLFTGDLAMRNLFPSFISPQSSAISWLDSLDQLDRLAAVRVVPAHGDLADRTVIGAYRDYIKALQRRVAELKRAGSSSAEVASQLRTEFAVRHPNWAGPERIAGAATVIYNETR